MKKLFILFVLTMVAASSAMAQKSGMAQNMAAKESTEQALTRMEMEIAEGLVKGDLKPFEMYVSDKATLVDPMGAGFTKAGALEFFRSGDIKFTSMVLSDIKVAMFGADTAVVTFVSTDKGTIKGQSIDGKTRWVDTFMKMNGKWWCIATAGSPIMEMK